MKNTKSADFPQRNCKIAWDRLVSKYAPHTALLLLKLKSEFRNSKLESVEKDPDEWILNLEELQIWMNEFGPKGSILYEDFRICIMNNLPKEYDVILENRLGECVQCTYNWCDSLKTNPPEQKIKNKNEEKEKKRRS